MEGHIISGGRNGLDDLAAHEKGPVDHQTAVIADAGDSAEVLVFPAGESVVPGAQFRYRGVWWFVTDHRRDSGILVAEPVPH
jgi:hypothetical protein